MTATSSWPGPTIIGGDFNHDLQSLPIWKSLEEHGWKESRTFSPCEPDALPPTYCKRDAQGSVIASSSKDFILLCHKICRLQSQMSIWEFSGLPDHNPMSWIWKFLLRLVPQDNENYPDAWPRVRRLCYTSWSKTLSQKKFRWLD